jgi:predicted CXXCH cytochrome family protein
MTKGGSARQVICTAGAVSLCLLVVACSPAARFRVMNFLFDGVPPPPGSEVPGQVPSSSNQRPLSPFAQGLRGIAGQERQMAAPRVVVSVHQPYAERKCSECHDNTRGLDDMSHDATLCDKCHVDQRKEEGWDHGPINLGTCVPCHVPHDSTYDHLLYAAVVDVCIGCHAEVVPGSPEYHDVPNFNDCVACHDPHRMY